MVFFLVSISTNDVEEMNMKKVALVDLGERLQLDLHTLAQCLNKKQSIFNFAYSEDIPTEAIGNPTVDDQWYDAKHLLTILQSRIQTGTFDFIIGITRHKITVQGDSVNRIDRDYFSLSNMSNSSIISVNNSVTKYNSASKTLCQYVCFLIMCELLINLARFNLTHTSTDYCLFDECEDRSTIAQGIDNAYICPTCIAKLKSHTVSQHIIDAAQDVLKCCRRRSSNYAIIQTIKNSFAMLAIGTCLGWIIRSFLVAEHWRYVVTAMISVPFIIYLWYKYLKK